MSRKRSRERESRMGVGNVSRKRESRMGVTSGVANVSRKWESQNGVAKIKNSGAYVMGIPKLVIN